MRNLSFVENEYYHVLNRGVDKRAIFISNEDVRRFLEGLVKFNTSEIVGHLAYRHPVSKGSRLVNIISYCVNKNHFHFILEQVAENGIEKFMHKLSMGYSKYFNIKYKRSGSLFQGRFRAIHIDSNEYLLHLSSYVNLNNFAHGRGIRNNLSQSSWEEYAGKSKEIICKKDIILLQFKNFKEYEKFAKDALKNIISRKNLLKELEEGMSTPGVDFVRK